jgi:nucleoside-diphosphate-sugar epimerase
LLRRALRLVHVSALGLHAGARSGFLRSKLSGERAIAACGSNYSIVRPSLLDGEGGYGALWFRRVARWPAHLLPADARGLIDALDVGELGEAIAVLCEKRDARNWREVELGGGLPRSIGDYLAALRPGALPPAPRIAVPAWLARLASHLCDLVHFSPLSFGHVVLMRRDNVPSPNRLAELLGRPPRTIGAGWRSYSSSSPGCGSRALPAPMSIHPSSRSSAKAALSSTCATPPPTSARTIRG